MPDPRFHKLAGPFTLAQLAEIAEAELAASADPGKVLRDVAPIETAGATDLTFLDNPRYLPQFAVCKAGACIVAPQHREKAPQGLALLLTSRPYSAYARAARAFYPPPDPTPGIHPTALIDPSAVVGTGCVIGPYVVVGPQVEIGANCHIAAQAVIDEGVVIGAGTAIGAGATLSHCIVGRDCQFHAGVRVGNRGFGFAMDAADYTDVPQLGRVIIGDRVELGANVTIDRGSGPDTEIGSGSKIDNLVQIGHNVRIGEGCVLVAQSGVAGSTKLEDRVVIAAQAGVAGHLTIGRGAQVSAKSGVMRDVAPGERVFGIPAFASREYFRLVSLWRRQLKTRGRKQ